jgi:hypothetical protein
LRRDGNVLIMIAVRNGALAALLTAGLLAVGAPARAADPVITVKSITASPNVVVLSSKAGCTNVVFTAELSAPLPAGTTEPGRVRVEIEGPLYGDDYLRGRTLSQVGTSATYRGTVPLCGSDRSGRYLVNAFAVVPTGTGTTYTDAAFTYVQIKRPSSVTLNASPEPVRKGARITAKGLLKVNGKVFARAGVKIYFKATGATTWTYRGTATTDSKGVYSKKFTATRSGVWKAVYEGDLKRAAAVAGDAVKVR